MGFEAKVLADSVSPEGQRLTSLELTYPRIVHSEMMTHRVFSRNSASTRAIAIKAQLDNQLGEFFVPSEFGVNKKGMQAFVNLTADKDERAREVWTHGEERALTTFLELILGEKVLQRVLGYEPSREYVSREVIQEHYSELVGLIPKADPDPEKDFAISDESMLNVHKQLAGRGLEAYMWHTIVLTGTEMENFFALRDHPDAQGEIATIARMAHEQIDASTPRELSFGEWHLPYVTDEDRHALAGDTTKLIQVSAARAAAASYNRQHARSEYKSLFDRYGDLLRGGHMSPLEHQARPFSQNEIEERDEEIAFMRHNDARRMQLLKGIGLTALNQKIEQHHFRGNLRGWVSQRKLIPNEDNFAKVIR